MRPEGNLELFLHYTIQTSADVLTSRIVPSATANTHLQIQSLQHAQFPALGFTLMWWLVFCSQVRKAY